MSQEEGRTQPKGEQKLIGQVGMGYLVVLLFLAAFLLLLAKGSIIHKDLGQPKWASLIALLIVLPLLLPRLMRYMGPRLTTVKFSSFVELTFKDLEATSHSPEELVKILKENVRVENINATTYANDMTSFSAEIVKTVKQLKENENEALVIDLRNADAWIPPNLFFLALLVASKTLVHQIVFVETGRKEKQFVAMCSPEELRLGLGRAFPDYPKAAESIRVFEPELTAAGMDFFSILRGQWEERGEKKEASHRLWLNSSVLISLMGNCLHWQQIEHKESLTEQDLRHILHGSHPYTAVLKGSQFLMLINRDKVALKVACAMIERTAT